MCNVIDMSLKYLINQPTPIENAKSIEKWNIPNCPAIHRIFGEYIKEFLLVAF